MTFEARLDPEPAAARRARHAVASTVPEDRVDERDTAMLLVSELVTNAVVHAASPVDLGIDVRDDDVVVTVTDVDTGPLVVPNTLATELGEGGRGFLLIDRLADAWGTEHHAGRKTVWFRVRREPRSPSAPARRQPAPAKADYAPVAGAKLHRLLLDRDVAGALTFDEHVRELLHRTIDAVPAHGASITLEREDSERLGVGRQTGDEAPTCELVVGDRSYGVLRVWPARPLDDDERAFVMLAADRIALVIAEHGLVHSQQARSADLDFVAEASELLTRPMSVALTLALVAQISVPRFADWCAAYAVTDRGDLHRLTVNHRQESRVDATVTLLDDDAEVREAIAAAALSPTPQRLPSAVVVAGQRSHVTVLPLHSRNRTVAVLAIGRSQPLDPVEYVSALELARRAALAVDNARLREEQADTVNALQTSLLPLALPKVPGISLGARYHSASPDILVGGDFYDAFSLGDNRFAVAIGDVCGKGAEAAAVTGMTRDLLRLLVTDGASPAQALRRLNRALIDHPRASRFCTVALAVGDVVGDELRLTLCLAGHPEPALRRHDGAVDFVGTAGGLLGVLDDDVLDLSELQVTLNRGELFVLYTDGVTERRAGTRMFGQHGIARALEDAGDSSADAVAEAIEVAARSFTSDELRDDLAILVVQH